MDLKVEDALQSLNNSKWRLNSMKRRSLVLLAPSRGYQLALLTRLIYDLISPFRWSNLIIKVEKQLNDQRPFKSPTIITHKPLSRAFHLTSKPMLLLQSLRSFIKARRLLMNYQISYSKDVLEVLCIWMFPGWLLKLKNYHYFNVKEIIVLRKRLVKMRIMLINIYCSL